MTQTPGPNSANPDGADMPPLDDRADRDAGPRVPYPGLRPFDRDEWLVFFGRREQTSQLIEKLGRSRFVAVVGPSGCGKSSLVRAGLIAAVQNGLLSSNGERWRVAEMRPGDCPTARLAEALLSPAALRDHWGAGPAALGFMDAALRRGPLALAEICAGVVLPEGENLLLLVDQFEEIFRYRREAAKSDDAAPAAAASAAARGAGREAATDGNAPEAVARRALARVLAKARSAWAALRRAWREAVPSDLPPPPPRTVPSTPPPARPAAAGPVAADEADAFVALLLKTADQPAGRVYVVLTMRADFLGDCAIFAGLPEAINDGQFLVPRLTREQRRAAIAGPAEAFGGTIDPALVGRLLNDMSPDPDQLPVLQHALMRMWASAGGPTDGLPELADDTAHADACATDAPAPPAAPARRAVVTQAHYDAVGGLGKALSDHANRVMADLAAGDAHLAGVTEAVFRLLVDVTPDNRRVRRPRRLREICDLAAAAPADVSRVVDAYRAEGVSFLMPPFPAALAPDTLIDISHESLIQRWDKLRCWSDDTARWARVVRRLRDAACVWDERRRPEDSLHRGLDLTEAAQAEARDPSALTPTDRAFLTASRARAKKDRWRKAWPVLGAMGVLVAIAGVSVGIWSWHLMKLANTAEDQARYLAKQAEDSSKSADLEREKAQRALVTTEALRLSSQADAALADSPRLGLLMAAAPFRQADRADVPMEPAVEGTLRSAVARVNGRPFLPGRRVVCSDVAAVADGAQWLVTVSDDDRLRRWNVSAPDGADGRPAPDREIPIQAATARELRLSPDGRWLVIRDADGAGAVWDLNASKAVRLHPPDRVLLSARFAENSQWLGIVTQFKQNTGAMRMLQPAKVWEGGGPAGFAEPLVHVWQTSGQTAEPRQTASLGSGTWFPTLPDLADHDAQLAIASVSGDGRWARLRAAFGLADQFIEMQRPSILERPAEGTGINRVDFSVIAFSADGRHVVTQSQRRGSLFDVRLWTRDPKSPDGAAASQALLDVAADPKFLWFDERPGNGIESGRAGGITAAAFSPDGKTFATADASGIVCAWGVDPGAAGPPAPKLIAAGRHARKGADLTFSPDGKWLLTVPAKPEGRSTGNPTAQAAPGSSARMQATSTPDKAYLIPLTATLPPVESPRPDVTVGTWGARPRFSDDGRWLGLRYPQAADPAAPSGEPGADRARPAAGRGQVTWWRLPAPDPIPTPSNAAVQRAQNAGPPPEATATLAGEDSEAIDVAFVPGGQGVLTVRPNGSMSLWPYDGPGTRRTGPVQLLWHENQVAALVTAAVDGAGARLLSLSRRPPPPDSAPDKSAAGEDVAVWRIVDGMPATDATLPLAATSSAQPAVNGGGPLAISADGGQIVSWAPSVNSWVRWHRQVRPPESAAAPPAGSDGGVGIAYVTPPPPATPGGVIDTRNDVTGELLARRECRKDGQNVDVQVCDLKGADPRVPAKFVRLEGMPGNFFDWDFGQGGKWIYTISDYRKPSDSAIPFWYFPRPTATAATLIRVTVPSGRQTTQFSPSAYFVAVSGENPLGTTEVRGATTAPACPPVPGRLPELLKSRAGTAYGPTQGGFLSDDELLTQTGPGEFTLWKLARDRNTPIARAAMPANTEPQGFQITADKRYLLVAAYSLVPPGGRPIVGPRLALLLFRLPADRTGAAAPAKLVPESIEAPEGAEVSPDGKWLAYTAGGSFYVRTLDRSGPSGGPIQQQFAGRLNMFSPEGNWLVSDAPGGRLCLYRLPSSDAGRDPEWAIGNHQLLTQGNATGSQNLRLKFQPNGDKLAVADRGTTVRLYTLNPRDPKAPIGDPVILQGHAKEIDSLEFSADGSCLFTRDADSVRAWPMSVSDVVADARAIAGRDLTDAERTRYRIASPGARPRESAPKAIAPDAASPPPAVPPAVPPPAAPRTPPPAPPATSRPFVPKAATAS